MSQYLVHSLHLDVIYVGEVTNGSSTIELVSISVFVIIWLRKFTPMKNSSGDSVSPWSMPHLMATCVRCLELISSLNFYNPNKFLRKVSVLLTLHSGRCLQIQVCGIEQQTFLQLIQAVFRLVSLDLETWLTVLSGSSWCFEPLILQLGGYDRAFHIVGRQVIGWQLNDVIPLWGSFMISSVLPWVSQSEWKPKASHWFICTAKCSCPAVSFLSQWVWNK